MSDDEDEGTDVLECSECGAAAFNFAIDGRILCDVCGSLLGKFSTRGAPAGVEVH